MGADVGDREGGDKGLGRKAEGAWLGRLGRSLRDLDVALEHVRIKWDHRSENML